MAFAKLGSEPDDLTFFMALQVEQARGKKTPFDGLGLDKEKCFDRLHASVLEIMRRAGYPPGLAGARANHFKQVRRRIRLGTSFGEVLDIYNGRYQGDGPVLDDCCFLMAFWLKRPEIAAGNTSMIFVDDPTTMCSDSTGIAFSIQETEV